MNELLQPKPMSTSHAFKLQPERTAIANMATTLLLTIVAMALGWHSPSQAQDRLILGVHPYLQHQEIKQRFSPLADYLSAGLGIDVEVRVGQNYQAHLQALANNQIDVAYLGPSLFVKLLRTNATLPLLARLEADGSPTFTGHIVVRKDSPLKNLQDLKGKVMAFGDPESTMGTLVPRALLLQKGIDLDDLAYYHHYAGHTNVALAVLTGDADAGAVKEEVFRKYTDRGLKSLMETPAISEHVFVASSSLNRAMVRKLRDLLLGISTPEQVKLVLKPIKRSATGLVSATKADYLTLRQLMEDLDP